MGGFGPPAKVESPVTRLPMADAGLRLSFPNPTDLPLPGQEAKWPGWHMQRWDLTLSPDLSPQSPVTTGLNARAWSLQRGQSEMGWAGWSTAPLSVLMVTTCYNHGDGANSRSMCWPSVELFPRVMRWVPSPSPVCRPAN